MNKMVINQLDKLFVTNDAATIVNELEVQHPTAKLLVLAGRAQQEEIGDGANLVVSFAGELLEKAEASGWACIPVTSSWATAKPSAR
jgi:T-complex protein 1 subunit theta